MDIDRKPLGVISLAEGKQKEVYPLDDFFIRYVFNHEENWERLREIVNTVLEGYSAKYNTQHGFHFVDEAIKVETQYEHYIKSGGKQPTQDISLEEHQSGDWTYLEIQNRKSSDPRISIRATKYCGLAINTAGDESKVSQIWLLGENDDDVLKGRAISNYMWMELHTREILPVEQNIMFVSLPRLMDEPNRCGKLAKLLMGADPGELDDKLKGIADMFKHEYDSFKKNRKVVEQMSYAEVYANEKVAENKAENAAMIEKFISGRIRSGAGLTGVKQMAMELGVSPKRFKELYDANRSAARIDRSVR